MKFRPYGKFGKKDKKVIILTLFICGSIIPYLAGGFYLMWHIPYEATMAYEIDDSEFIEANYTRMMQMSRIFNFHYDRDNTPLNYTLTVYWNDTSYTNISFYGTSGDAAIWSGMNLAAQSLHYAVAKRSENQTEIDYALKLVDKALRGVSILIAVPSGGIGEKYPCILSRSVSPKDWVEKGNSPIDAYNYDDPDSMDPNDIFNGVGDYKDWWWKGYPSTDQWSGIILGLGQCARVFMDEKGKETKWIRERVKDLVIQIIENFKKSNWMILDMNKFGGSRTTGQDFKLSLEMTGVWVLSILKMGMIACPDKYTELYYHYALERNYINAIEADLRIFNLMNYYSLNINYNMLTNLVSLEEDPSLRIRYENIVNKIYYPIIRISRNAWFNLGYLYMMHKDNLKDYSADEKLIVKDVEDQMMRFDVSREPNGTNRVPDRGGDRNEVKYKFSDPTEKYRKNFIINFLYGYLLDLYSKEISEYAKRVDEYQNSDFLWQRTPWEEEEYTLYIRQDSGLAYLLPYYIGLYLNVFKED
ncbi:MAG: hypothetical protein ACTSQJ_07400 [Promethearchaeota archaeon]